MAKRLFILVLILGVSQLFAQENTVFCEQISALQKLIKKRHYQPKAVNDSLSKHVFALFIKQLDEEKHLFTQGDISNFKKDLYQLDDYIESNDCSFIDSYASTLQSRIEKTKLIVEALGKQPFDYSGKDTLYFKPNKEYSYFKDETAVKRYWDKRLRYNIVSELIEEDSIFKNLKTNFKVLEQQTKPKIIQNQLCILDELLNKKGGIALYVKEAFLNAYAKYQDPNSSFYNPSDKALFESTVSNNQLSFGIITSKSKNGDIVIVHVTPGSAAFKNGNFEVNDIIKSLSTDTETLETYCISNSDILAFTSEEAHKTITFKIKKENGAVEHIELTKTVIKIEENTVRGYVISNNIEVGYISIPSFYTDMESPKGLGLANDVAKELYKLKKENIEALIIDLRFNGGGSMKEAADLSGMFINRGPLSILKHSNGETVTIKDANRGTLFNQPIIVLVNHFSASASELFAGVMQDYNRAVIVGSTTHGKASAQVILPLSRSKNLGFSKLTIERFYRVTGQSNQSKGIIPDIPLPSLYDNFKTAESFEKHALQNDSILVKLKHIALSQLPIEQLKTKSKLRIIDNVYFGSVKNLNHMMLINYVNRNKKYPLTLDNVYREMTNYNKQWKDFYSQIDQQKSQLIGKNTTSTNEIIKYNDEDVKTNKKALKDLTKDLYIQEAHNIIQDLLIINNSN